MSDPHLAHLRTHPILLFDGVCNLCNGAVQFVIKNDKNGRIYFAPLQSEIAKKLLRQAQDSIQPANSDAFAEIYGQEGRVSGEHIHSQGGRVQTPGEHIGTRGARVQTPGEHIGTRGEHAQPEGDVDGGRSFGTVVLLDGNQIFTQSAALLHLLRYLRWPWPILYGGYVIPKPLRDGLYRVVANHRYKWFGRRDTCMVPSPRLADRFLDES